MLRLSRFRGRRGVLSRPAAELWQAACGEEVPSGEMQALCRGVSGIAFDGSSICSNSNSGSDWRNGRRGLDLGSSRMHSRGFADEAGGDDDDGGDKEGTGDMNEDSAAAGGGKDRMNLLQAIEKDRSLQDDIGKFLYGSSRGQVDTKLLLGSLYIKAGLRVPTYSSRAAEGQFVGEVVANGKRFAGVLGTNKEEAEKNAAASVINWILGQKRRASTTQATGRGRGARGGRGAGAERGRGRGRGGRGSGPPGKNAQRVAIKPLGCMQVEVNYKIMKAVVLYPTQEILYPYKNFPAHQDLKAIYKESSSSSS